MDIKVQCECGQRFAFEVEPENGRMPTEVACPSCGLDATARANAIIQAKIEGANVGTGLNTGTPKLRLSRPAEPEPVPVTTAPSAHASRASAPASRTPAASGLSPTLQAMIEREERRTLIEASDQPRIGWGIAGAVIGGIIGMTGWYYLIVLTKVEIGYAAWGVGLLCGFGAKIGCKYTGPLMGLVAGICALVAIVLGQFLGARANTFDEIDRLTRKFGEMGGQVLERKAEMTDDSIRERLARERSRAGATVRPDQILQADVDRYRADDGAAARSALAEASKSIREELGWSWEVNWALFKNSLGWFTLLWLFLGVGSAYRVGSYGSDD
jgi:hypothetical protein